MKKSERLGLLQMPAKKQACFISGKAGRLFGTQRTALKMRGSLSFWSVTGSPGFILLTYTTRLLFLSERFLRYTTKRKKLRTYAVEELGGENWQRITRITRKISKKFVKFG